MFLLSGTPDGVKIVEKSNWVGRAIAGPRSSFDELRKRPEFQKTGVYVLTGRPIPMTSRGSILARAIPWPTV
jgi:hypothetical protein